MLEESGNAASWYDVTCDEAGRPTLFTRYQFGERKGLTAVEYGGQSVHLTRLISKNPDGDVLNTEVVERDDRLRPAKVEVLGPDGEAQKIGLFSYDGDAVELTLSEAKGGAFLMRARKWFDDSGALTRAYWYYPKYWYDYHYDPKTGLYPSHDKYDGDLKFEITEYQYDRFGNTLSRRSRCIVKICNTVENSGEYDHGLFTHEEARLKSGHRLVWENSYDDESRLSVSQLSVNGRFALRFVVERDGSLIRQTVAYSPKGKKLFVYDRAATVYINRDGSPANGGKYKRFTKRNVW
jgi:hypothetical protein